MSIRFVMHDGDRDYALAEDWTGRWSIVATGRVLDEITHEPVRTSLEVRLRHPGLRAKIADDGLFCITRVPGVPLGTESNLAVEMTLGATGYREVVLTVDVPLSADAPFSLPDPVLLRPLPVRLHGRVMTNAVVPNPIADAWIQLVDPAVPPGHVIALRTPLHFDHAPNTTVRARPLGAVGAPQSLLRPSPAGSQTLLLDSRAGLAIDDIVRIGPSRECEYGIIDSLAPLPANPAFPGEIQLRFPLNRSFPGDVQVQKVVRGPAGAAGQLIQAVNAGDGLLLLNAALGGDTLEVADPTPDRVEYHAVGALTDEDGFYRMDGIGGVRRCRVRASSGVLNATAPWTIDFRRAANIVDFQL